MNRLWKDIQTALENGLKRLNLAVEPVTTQELYKELTGENFVNELSKPVPYFNYKTKYAAYWNGANGYILTKEQVMEDLKRYIQAKME